MEENILCDGWASLEEMLVLAEVVCANVCNTVLDQENPLSGVLQAIGYDDQQLQLRPIEEMPEFLLEIFLAGKRCELNAFCFFERKLALREDKGVRRVEEDLEAKGVHP